MSKKPKEGTAAQRSAATKEPVTRVRRGKIVEVPPQWVGHVPHQQTVKKRDSKQAKSRNRKTR